jgi:hypothetical protein
MNGPLRRPGTVKWPNEGRYTKDSSVRVNTYKWGVHIGG